MSKLKSLTENRYTLNDIFTKSYEKWLLAPLFIYLLTPVIHMIVYALGETDNFSLDAAVHYIGTGELPGDYYSPIIHYSFWISALCALAAVISYLIYAKRNKLKKLPDAVPMIFFGLYLLLILISTIVNKTEFDLIFGLTPRAEGVASIFFYFLVFYLCGSLVKKEKYKYAVLYSFVIIGAVIAALTLIDRYAFDIYIIGDFTDDAGKMVSGIFYTHNFYAYFLSMSVIISAALVLIAPHRAGKIFAFLSLCLNTVVLAINDSFGGFLACVVAFLFLIVAVSIKNKKFSIKATALTALFFAIIFVVGLFTPSFFGEIKKFGNDVETVVTNGENAENAGTNRWGLWVNTAKYVREKPFIGWGYEGTVERLVEDTDQEKPHNEYLENMVNFGIPAGLLYIAGLISIYIKALKRRKYVDNATVCCLAGALAYIASSFVGNSFIFIAPFYYIFLGLANNTVPEEKPLEENFDDEPEKEIEINY